jgi:cysteine desulfurase
MDILKYFGKKAAPADLAMPEKVKKIEPKTERIYLDYAAITPMDPAVEQKMRAISGRFYNPSSLYAEAVKNKEAITEARKTIASFFNIQSDEIVFTASGTEANNLAILGVFNGYQGKKTPHFIVSAIEHPSVLEACAEVERLGGQVSYVLPEKNGAVDPKKIRAALKSTTVLVSVMYANNEIGTIQSVGTIGRMVKEYREQKSGDAAATGASANDGYPFFHTDACQAPNYLPIHTGQLSADMVTLDGGKVYGPRGIGLLAVRRAVPLHPIIFGGGQEKGLRSGTENVAAIVGFAEALTIAEKMRESEGERLVELREYMEGEIKKKFPDAIVHGEEAPRLPNVVNVCFPGLDAEFAVIKLDNLGIMASAASACQSNAEENYSQTVAALPDVGETCKRSSLRFSMGRYTTKKDVSVLLKALAEIVTINS